MKNNIIAKNLKLGYNAFIHPTASIRGINGEANNIEIGDNVYIRANVQIICDDFILGDYCKIQHNTNIHGYLPCKIGHNAWIGQYSIIDSIGGTEIGNNCGIGAHSQLWSHIKYGDTLEGCRFLNQNKLDVGNDVWFVGHCIVSPIKAEDKSMAFAGSVITTNMLYNEIYAGTPAKSISDKVGFQFNEINIEDKIMRMENILNKFTSSDKIKIVRDLDDANLVNDITYFIVSQRAYTKKKSEIEFMKYLLPDKAKFTPLSN
jgi:acetyltransferase-like isoleucine patch superfamily enzyme